MSEGLADTPQHHGPGQVPSANGGLCRQDAEFARIAWRCRRGLLELDLWLGGFWATHRATLEPDETAALTRLLALSDMEILDRLHGRIPPDDAKLAALLNRLQHFREAR